MDIKFSEGLEFVVDEKESKQKPTTLSKEQEDALKDIIREGFRAPVGASEKITLTIAGTTFPVFNLSAGGVGIYLNDINDLTLRSKVSGMVLDLNGKKFTLAGTVVHISRDEANFLCGIDLDNIDDDCRQELLEYLQKSKHSLFNRL